MIQHPVQTNTYAGIPPSHMIGYDGEKGCLSDVAGEANHVR